MEKNIQKLSIKQASEWASSHLNRKVTASNISYLIQYGRIRKHNENGDVFVDKDELIAYYDSYFGSRENNWRDKLGDDLNWTLSFEQIKEAETTKHIHRLHPYKGKFIPQLVEYFLDSHTDKFKNEVYFNKGDVILDPFCGSGTTLVQANELGMHAVGIDVSAFNTLITNVKINRIDLYELQFAIKKITASLKTFVYQSRILAFDKKLTEELNKFNNQFFPVPDYKYKVAQKQIDETTYGADKEKEFLMIYRDLLEKFNIQLMQDEHNNFLDVWYTKNIRAEIDFTYQQIMEIDDAKVKDVLSVILSRTIRSCRATTHADLATLKEPTVNTYYCAKHGKICKPLFTILSWWERYSNDTVHRLVEFNQMRTDTWQYCITGDSRNIDLLEFLTQQKPELADIVAKKRVRGIFSSPPYVGLIDYHEQHAYAYDLFNFPRHDENEIGAMSKGIGKKAKDDYVDGIVAVLVNCKKYMMEDFEIFLVANDKYNLYPSIAEKSNLCIIEQFKRPVLNRTEKDKGAYSEIIFRLKEK